MFHSAALKLTLWYLAIIMALSIGCSFALYHVSSTDLERNARRQVGYFGGLLGPDDANDFAHLRQKQLNEDKHHLEGNLIAFNVLVLLGGGAVSYILARRTLQPIEDALDRQIRFTADASHELRTPLTAMQTENEVAIRNSNLTKPQAIKIIKSNLEEIGKLKSLAEGLLRLATANETDDTWTSLSLKEVLKKAEDRVAKAAKLKNININSQLPVADIRFKANEQNLVDLIVVLLDNAIKYSPGGGKIEVNLLQQAKNIEIQIKDYGQGIKAADLPRIFDRFYRGDSSRHKHDTQGYGLGLAIAKKIAEQYHGYIHVASTLEKGSTFTITLPLK